VGLLRPHSYARVAVDDDDSTATAALAPMAAAAPAVRSRQPSSSVLVLPRVASVPALLGVAPDLDAETPIASAAPPLDVWSGAAVRAELALLFHLALPVMCASMLTQLLNVVDLMFVGNMLGERWLAAAALGNMCFGAVATVISGAATAVDTLCSRAFDARQYPIVGLFAQRGLMMMLVLAAPAMAALATAGRVFDSLLGHSQVPGAPVAGGGEVSSFCDSLILGLLPLSLSMALTRYLAAQGVVWPAIYIDLLATIVDVGLNAVLVDVEGFMGAPLATSIARTLQLAALAFYMARWRPQDAHGTWPGWQLKRAVGDTKAVCGMATLAGVGAVTFALETWPLEATNLLAARHGVSALGAHAACLNICGFIFLGPPLGMAAACAARLPVLLADPRAGVAAAQRTALLAVSAGVAYVLFTAYLTLEYRVQLGGVFSQSPTVMALVADIALLAGVYQVLDALQGTLAGVLRGLGYDRAVTLVSVLACGCVTLPVGAALTHIADGEAGIGGVWTGLLVGSAAAALALLAMYRRVDWPAVAAAAVKEAQLQAQLAAGAGAALALGAGEERAAGEDGRLSARQRGAA
jgi:MATE family multidrug resistance protein